MDSNTIAASNSVTNTRTSTVSDLISRFHGASVTDLLGSDSLYNDISKQLKKLDVAQQQRFYIQLSDYLSSAIEYSELLGSVLKRLVDQVTDNEWANMGLKNIADAQKELRYQELQNCASAAKKKMDRRNRAMQKINEIWEEENWLELFEEAKLIETEVIWGINFTENLAKLAALASDEEFHLDFIIEQLQAAIKERHNRSGSRTESTLIASDITYAILSINSVLEHEKESAQPKGSTQLVETSLRSIGMSKY